MITYELTDDERAVVDAAKQVAQAADPWSELASGGWLDLLIDDPDNGMGYLGLVAEQLGMAGAAVPLATTAGAWATAFGETAGGRKVGVVTGDLCEDGAGAELVMAKVDGELGGYDSFEVEAVGGLEGDGLARVTITGEPIARCRDADADSLSKRRATALAEAEMAGLLRRGMDMTLEHLKTREQFGRPLAAFQVIQHGAARLATIAEAATYAARLAVHDPSGDNIHATKGWLSAASQEASALSHQLHGAIGFTEEYGLQKLTKRLRVLRFAWGDDRTHYEALGRRRASA